MLHLSTHQDSTTIMQAEQTVPNRKPKDKPRFNKGAKSKKIAKGESTVQRDPMFDVMPEDNIDHMETEDAQSEGRTKEMVDEDKEIDEDRLSTEEAVSTDIEKSIFEGTEVQRESTKINRLNSLMLGQTERAVVKLPDPKLKFLGKRDIKCIFVRYAEQSKAFRFSSVPRLSLRIPNKTEDIGGLVVPQEVAEEVVQQPEPEHRKSKRNRT
ncbi:hypothetical protein Tco_0336601 [Tanacetum coccineum]